MKNLRQTGKLGEDLASTFLLENDYIILENNYCIRAVGEIDIIAKKNNHLVFIEVKLSNTNSFDDPVYRVTKTKQKRLFATAEIYLSEQVINYESYSFDVITLKKVDDKYDIAHLQNAFWG